ncbi:MAG: hypothetical protein R6U32_01435 [Candidatus Woesearchaeota archaeon]
MRSIFLSLGLVLLFLVAIPSAFSLAPGDTLQKFEETARMYDIGEISVAQLVILLENHKAIMDNRLKEKGMAGWSRSEVEGALDEYKTEYGHMMRAHDLNIFLGMHSPDDEHYRLGYNIGARKYPDSYYKDEFDDDVRSLIDNIKGYYENGKPSVSEVGRQSFDVFEVMWNINTYDGCVGVMEGLSVMEETSGNELADWFFDYHPKDSRIFSAAILEETKEECMRSHDCRGRDDCVEQCGSNPPRFQLIGICSKSDPENNYFVLEHSGYKSGLSYGNDVLNRISGARKPKKCEPWNYEPALYLRMKLQDAVDERFFDWYVHDFLGEDVDKHINSGDGFERLMQLFADSEMKVSETLECKGKDSWPDEFEKIEIDYVDGNIEFHIWEEMVHVDGRGIVMWSTLYRYRVLGDKGLMRQIIKRQLSENSAFEPGPEERREIKSEEHAMEILHKLTSGFGDSLDFKFILEGGEENIFSRRISINDDVIFRVAEDGPRDLDFTASLTFDDFYEFIDKATSMNARAVNGPGWVDTDSMTPMMISERIGMVFKLWNSVSVDPVMAKLRLSAKIGNMLSYLKEIGDQSSSEQELNAHLGDIRFDEEGNVITG